MWVFDVLRKEVAILKNERMAAGAHAVTFDASRFSGGVYFYTLRAGASVFRRKMILLP